jgi:hypothetical protein
MIERSGEPDFHMEYGCSGDRLTMNPCRKVRSSCGRTSYILYRATRSRSVSGTPALVTLVWPGVVIEPGLEPVQRLLRYLDVRIAEWVLRYWFLNGVDYDSTVPVAVKDHVTLDGGLRLLEFDRDGCFLTHLSLHQPNKDFFHSVEDWMKGCFDSLFDSLTDFVSVDLSIVELQCDLKRYEIPDHLQLQ